MGNYYGKSPAGFGAPKGSKSSREGIIKSGVGESDMMQLERRIQEQIDKQPGLRRAIDAYKLDPSNYGSRWIAPWTIELLRQTLLQITWDASAEVRDNRHHSGNLQIPHVVLDHLDKLASLSLQTTGPSDYPRKILDVGCGTGVLLSHFLRHPRFAQSQPSLYGVDLSAEMIAIAQRNVPFATFHHGDFQSFHPPLIRFQTILFHECLHYFLDPFQALQHASALLEDTPGSRIILSHPKGAKNVFLQHNTNRLLAASLLPSADELSAWLHAPNYRRRDNDHDLREYSNHHNTGEMKCPLHLTVSPDPDPVASTYIAVLQRV